MADAWAVVGRRGKARPAAGARAAQEAPASSGDAPEAPGRAVPQQAERGRRPARVRSREERLADLRAQVEAAKEEILASDFWREVQRRMQQAEEDAVEAATSEDCATWDAVQALVILGLGSLERGAVPRYQLALALLLAEGLERLAQPVQARDPCFSDLDKALLAELGCQVLETDAEAFRCLERPTLCFLPHCPASMAHNLAAANWEAGALRRLALLGNSFVRMAEAWQATPRRLREDQAEPTAVLALVEAGDVVDAPISECRFPVRAAFNDMSVMLFPSFAAGSRRVEPLDLSHLLPRPE